MKSSTENMLGYAVDKREPALYVDEVSDWIAKGDHCKWLACVNPYSYMVSLKDEVFSKALRDADWLIPDGIGIVIASRLLRGDIRERVTGFDLFDLLQKRLDEAGGYRVFILGSTEVNLSDIWEKMKKDYPHFKVGGIYSPPYKSEFTREDTQAMVDAVNASGADVLWVGMTAPKQEKWIFENRHKLKVKFAGAIGGAFDFYSGRKMRAPRLIQKVGMEWVVRLAQEPFRLWPRFFLSLLFFWKLFLAMMFGKKPMKE